MRVQYGLTLLFAFNLFQEPVCASGPFRNSLLTRSKIPSLFSHQALSLRSISSRSTSLPIHRDINHIVISTLGSQGDLFPFLAIGKELLQRGYRITFLTNPYYKELVDQAGLDFAPLGTVQEFLDTINNPQIFGEEGTRVLLESIAPITGPTYEWIAQNTDPTKTLILTNRAVLGASVAHEMGIPLVTGDVYAAEFLSRIAPPQTAGLLFIPYLPPFLRWFVYWMVEHYVIDPILSPHLEKVRSSLGLEGRIKRIYFHWLLKSNMSLGFFTDWFAAYQKDWPKNFAFTGFPFYEPVTTLSAELEGFLDQGPPPVVFYASSANLHVEEFFRESLEASQMGGYRAVFIGPLDKMPANLPDTVFATNRAAFGPLFERALALVQPAGIGTGALAMRAGLPQLVFPLAHDQLDNGKRFVDLGVAHLLQPSSYKGPAVAAALQRLLADRTVKEHVALAQQFFRYAKPGQEVAADKIEALIKSLREGAPLELPQPLPGRSQSLEQAA